MGAVMLCSSKLSISFNSPESPRQTGFREEAKIAIRQRVKEESIRERTTFACTLQGPSLCHEAQGANEIKTFLNRQIAHHYVSNNWEPALFPPQKAAGGNWVYRTRCISTSAQEGPAGANQPRNTKFAAVSSC